jgi:4-hydroxy-2-oxoheptanedioate aldolase
MPERKQPVIKSLRSRLSAGEVVYGSWLNLASSLTAEILGRAGFDWLLIDMEHGTGDFRELVHQLQAIEATPAVPLVRVAWNEPWLIKRTLDLGPSGLIIPLINSAAAAEKAVQAMRYPPAGLRGVASMTRPTSFGIEFEKYFASAHDLLLTALQIELKEAIDDIEAIAAVPGVDVLFIGPLDLTTSLGVPCELQSEITQQALRQIEQAARRHGKVLGILLPDSDSVAEYVARGYQFIGISSDGGLLNQAARSMVRTLIEPMH